MVGLVRYKIHKLLIAVAIYVSMKLSNKGFFKLLLQSYLQKQ